MVTTLLLVDDDAFVRGALARALNRAGAFSVVPAAHGQQALDVLAAERVDAILTDLQMPVMDGLTLLGHLFERGIRLPVAVMTGHAIAPAMRQQLAAYGIAATFTKPVDISVLADELQRVLDPETVGRIRGITLFGFLQLLEVEQKTGLVVVHAGGQEGRLYFADGVLVHAHTRGLGGVEAAYEILSWPDPTVEIFYKRRAREVTVEERLQHVLMEAARLLDERGRDGDPGSAGASAAPAPAAPPRRVHDFDTLPAQSELEAALEIDGAVGVALVHVGSGMTLGMAGGTAALDMEVAGAAAAEVARAKLRAIGTLKLGDAIQDMMITLGRQYHLIRFVTTDVFIFLILDRERASLGMARHRLAQIARRIQL